MIFAEAGRIGVLAVPHIRNRLYAGISNCWVNLWMESSYLPCGYDITPCRMDVNSMLHEGEDMTVYRRNG
jgi:hypothetical protein